MSWTIPGSIRKVARGGEQTGRQVDAERGCGCAEGPRYRMLESLRLYGGADWEEGQLRQRSKHREYFVRFAEAAEPAFSMPTIDLASTGLRGLREPSVRVRRSAGRRRSAALRLASALWLFWGAADRHGEGSRWLETALAAASEAVAPVVRAPATRSELPLFASRDLERHLTRDRPSRSPRMPVTNGNRREPNRRSRWSLGRPVSRSERPRCWLNPACHGGRPGRLLGGRSDLIAAVSGIRAGRLDLVERTSRQVLTRATDRLRALRVLGACALGVVAERRSDLVVAVDELDEALAVARRLDLPHYVALLSASLRLAMLTATRRRVGPSDPGRKHGPSRR